MTEAVAVTRPIAALEGERSITCGRESRARERVHLLWPTGSGNYSSDHGPQKHCTVSGVWVPSWCYPFLVGVDRRDRKQARRTEETKPRSTARLRRRSFARKSSWPHLKKKPSLASKDGGV